MNKVLFFLMLYVIVINIYSENEVILHPLINELGNDWFEVKASTIIENITPDEAREIALEKAYNAAVEYYSGISVSGRSEYIHIENNEQIQIDQLSKLVKQTANGIILEKEIINEITEIIDNRIYIILTVKLKVGKQLGEIDQNFHLNAKLNKDYFKEGESLEVKITPSIDCYIIILNVMSDENVVTIFPNVFREDNFIKANKEFTLPNEEDIDNGINFELGLLPGKDNDTELIKIIASKKPINFSVNSNYKSAFESLQNWLVNIPLNEITEVDLKYVIYK